MPRFRGPWRIARDAYASSAMTTSGLRRGRRRSGTLSLLPHLHNLRAASLIADCGDFFEGTGYYQLGKGASEREILTTLCDSGAGLVPHQNRPSPAMLRRLTSLSRAWITWSRRTRCAAVRPGGGSSAPASRRFPSAAWSAVRSRSGSVR